MLRLWRDYLAQRWERDYWPVAAAVSYALPGKAGNLYRLDGWRSLGFVKPWKYSGGYSNPSVANNIGDGLKRLYVYPYNVAPFLTNTPTGVSGEAHGHQIKPR